MIGVSIIFGGRGFSTVPTAAQSIGMLAQQIAFAIAQSRNG